MLVASGPDGRLYRVTADLDVLLLTGVDAKQITRFASNARSGALTAFATAAPGRVMTIGNGVQSPARYTSSVKDTWTTATWGQIRWEGSGAVTLSTRSGNTDHPDDSWSDWSPAYTHRDGEAITSPAARYIQWRAVFTAAASGPSSALTSVTVAFGIKAPWESRSEPFTEPNAWAWAATSTSVVHRRAAVIRRSAQT